MNDHKKNTILLIGQNPETRDLLGSRLRSNYFRVELGSSGLQALSLLENPKNFFDLVILIREPLDIGAFETLSLIRSLYPKAKLPVILINDFESHEDKNKALEWEASQTLPSETPFIEVLKNIKLLLKE